MKTLLLIIIALSSLAIVNRSEAQSFCYSPVVPIVRYNMVPTPVYRHCEDPRRYNAAPHRFGYQAQPSVRATVVTQSAQCCDPVKVRTEIVSQRCQPTFYYDSCGRRLCRHVTVTIYKDIYSNGACRLWQHVSA